MSSDVFEIQEIVPEVYRKKSRNSTLIIMGIFIVIGFICAMTFVSWWGEYTNNSLVLNLMGGLVGLVITALIVKTFFINKPWMFEAMYGVRLKRHLMMVTNRLRPIQEAAQAGDETAMKVLRFYHLGLTQMHKFDNNSSASLDLVAEKQALEKQLNAKKIDLHQTCLNPADLSSYRNQSAQED